MKRTLLCAATLAVAAVSISAPAGQPQGVEMRYRLDEGQVLVYKATTERLEETETRNRNGKTVRSESASWEEVVFSVTADKATAGGSTPVMIEILDIKLRRSTDDGDTRRTTEADAQGAKIYEGNKLVEEGKWGEIQLPDGLDLRAPLAARIKADINERGVLSGFDQSAEPPPPMQDAAVMILLFYQPHFPIPPIVKGTSWTEGSGPVGPGTLTAAAAVKHLGRDCLKLNVGSDSDTTGDDGTKIEYHTSGTAIVDFATGVLFSYTDRGREKIRGGPRHEDTEIRTTTTISYIGGREVYDQYKAKRAPQG